MADGPKPEDTIRYGRVEAAIWRNEGENGDFLNTTFSRSYRQDDEWKQTNSFQEVDLPTLSKLADDAHSKIQELKKKSNR